MSRKKSRFWHQQRSDLIAPARLWLLQRQQHQIASRSVIWLPFAPQTDIAYQNQGFLLVRVPNQGTSLPDDFACVSPVEVVVIQKAPNLLDFPF